MNMALKLVKYGSDHFDLEKFKSIEDSKPIGWVKPKGGLWTSPVDSKFGWKQWCKAEDFEYNFKKGFQLNYSGNTIVIDSLADLDKLHWRSHGEWMHYPVFEPLLAEGWDAIYLTEKGQWETRLTHPRNLYGWDCECVLILNPKSVVEIPKMKLKWRKKNESQEKRNKQEG